MNSKKPDTSRIHVLSDQVANKIAAGEVVERPASVLKEVMENSLDAGAQQIDVELVQGGRKLVKVADNGSGMSRDDALLSIERFATSKIRDVEDIEHVNTLGFRGEALAAISSVSRFTLKTCTEGDVAGTEIIMSGGKMQDVRDIGWPRGTCIEVRNLFFNVPARRKFLRAQQTELMHLKNVFMLYCLAHPAVGMTMKADGRDVHVLPPAPDLQARLKSLFKSAEEMELSEARLEWNDLRVWGFVAKPPYSRADRSEQFLFVNGRPAAAPVVYRAIREGFHTMMPRDRHPAVFLFLEIDPEKVDVNVHPTKKEVRFRNSSLVRDALTEAIRNALRTHLPPEAPPRQEYSPAPDITPLSERIEKNEPAPVEQPSFPYFKVVPEPGTPRATAPAPVESRPVSSEPVNSASPTPSAPWTSCRILGQVGGLYVLLETEDGIVIMDPHATHERVLFEQFSRRASEGKPESQQLLTPETVELDPHDAHVLKRNIKTLRKLGFGIDEFGPNTFMVDALPSCFSHVAARQLILDVLDEIETSGSRSQGRMIEDTIAGAACKAAVKASGKLSMIEIEELIRRLASAEMPYTCPHGRPTVIHTSFRELHRKFGRE